MAAFIGVFFGAPWLGHGMRLEATLALLCGVFSLALVIYPESAFDAKATLGFARDGHVHELAIPFLMKALLTGSGVIANINGHAYSRYLRLCGALIGSFIWAAITYQYATVGIPLSFGSVCAGVFLFSSIGIIGMAFANLPRPGERGPS